MKNNVNKNKIENKIKYKSSKKIMKNKINESIREKNNKIIKWNNENIF